jgi:hypothetical protein
MACVPTRPAPPGTVGQRAGQIVTAPHQFAAVAGAVGIRLFQGRRLDTAVEDELQTPHPQVCIPSTRPDAIFFHNGQVVIHRASRRDGGGRSENHRVAADGQLTLGVGPLVRVPFLG